MSSASSFVNLSFIDKCTSVSDKEETTYEEGK